MTDRHRPIRICYAGTYERDYPRNRLIIGALRRAGCRVEEAHAPVFELMRDKSTTGTIAGAWLLLRLLLAWLRLAPNVALRLLRCDALAIGYIGQGDMLVLAPIARMMGRPVLFNPLVTLTDTLVEDRARLRQGSIPARAIAAIDRASLHLADVILVDTEANGRYLRERFAVPETKIVVVPVGADESIFAPSPAEQFSDDSADQHALDVLFVGKFIPLHGIEAIVRAAALLHEQNSPVRIELVGTGQTYVEMRLLADQLGLTSTDTLVWTDWIPFECLGDRLRAADVALGVFGSGEKAARVIPNKVYQSIACGVATITLDSPAVRAVLNDDSALLVPPDDPRSLAVEIIRLTDPIMRQRVGTAGREAYERFAGSAALSCAVAPAIERVEQLSARQYS